MQTYTKILNNTTIEQKNIHDIFKIIKDFVYKMLNDE